LLLISAITYLVYSLAATIYPPPRPAPIYISTITYSYSPVFLQTTAALSQTIVYPAFSTPGPALTAIRFSPPNSATSPLKSSAHKTIYTFN
jgi:hypothetical protein